MMGNKKLLILIFIVTLAIILNLSFYYWKNKITEENTKLKPEYLEWYNSTSKFHDFNHPYVKCLIDNKCEGFFRLILYAYSNYTVDEINKTLTKYGEIKQISSEEDFYTINLNIVDIKSVNNFIDSPLFYKIELVSVSSNYSINVSEEELIYCKENSDCTKAKLNCCAGSSCGYKPINRKFRELWENTIYCANTACTGSVCLFLKVPICDNNQCTFSDIQICNSDDECAYTVYGCLNPELADTYNFSYAVENYLGCKCVNNKCVESLRELKENKTEENKSSIITENLTIEIIAPLRDSNITTKNFYIVAESNVNAACSYRVRNINGDFSILELMNETDGMIHSQIIENIGNDGIYELVLNCTDESGNSDSESKFFEIRTLMPGEYTRLKKNQILLIGDSIPSKLTKSNLPGLLEQKNIEWTDIPYIQEIFIGNLKIENSTSGDLNSQKVLIEIGTDVNNYLYRYKLIFGKNVNFSKMDWETIELLGVGYRINKTSTNQRIVLDKKESESKLIVENNQPLKIDEEAIEGTYSNFSFGSDNNIIILEMRITMQDLNKDYISVGESWDDSVFNNLRFTFKSYSEETGAEIYIGSVKDY